MTRLFARLAALCLAILCAAPAFAATSSPIGQWQVTTGEARYTVTSCDGEGLCAKLVWLRADARTDDNIALLNHYIVRGAEPAGEGVWNGNVTFNGHSYDGTMQMVSKNFMTLKGCSGILCQTFEFTRL